MTITQSNIFSGAYTTLKNFINTNITDPKKRLKKNWIHPSMPNITDQSFEGYPFIVIQTNVSEDDKAFDRSTSNKQFRATLSIYADQSEDVDTIADDIGNKYKDETLTDSLSDFGSIELASSPFDFMLIGGRKIHRRIIGLIGVKRI